MGNNYKKLLIVLSLSGSVAFAAPNASAVVANASAAANNNNQAATNTGQQQSGNGGSGVGAAVGGALVGAAVVGGVAAATANQGANTGSTIVVTGKQGVNNPQLTAAQKSKLQQDANKYKNKPTKKSKVKHTKTTTTIVRPEKEPRRGGEDRRFDEDRR